MSFAFVSQTTTAEHRRELANQSAWQKPSLSRLSGREWERRLLHMFPAVWPLTEPFLPAPETTQVTILMCLLVAAFSTLVWVRFSSISRDGEKSIAPSVLGYSITIISLLLLFPRNRELAMTALVILALGDGSATLGGLLFRGPRLPWNADKRWAGFLSFVFCSGPVAALVYFLGMPESYPVWAALVAGMLAATMGAFVESLKSRLNDNVRVGVVVAVVLVGLHVSLAA